MKTLAPPVWRDALLGLSRATYTVFTTPKTAGHDETIYLEVAQLLRTQAQPLQPALTDELAEITHLLTKTKVAAVGYTLDVRTLLGLMSVFMQFSSYLPRLRPLCVTPFDHIEQLYQAVVVAGSREPLDSAGQLSLTLRLTSGDLPEALWRLFITSRLYARWFDTSIVTGLPVLSRKEIIERMLVWSRSLAASKAYGSCPDQDASGDVYYCWTHALARVIYMSRIASQNILSKLEAEALKRGTDLNHGLAHRFKPQRLPSDHTIAAAYGNAIGDICVRFLEKAPGI